MYNKTNIEDFDNKIKEARAYFNLPEKSNSIKTIVGVMLVGKEKLFIRSGEHGGPFGGTHLGGFPRGPGYGFSSGGPSQSNIATHVEGHAAAIMHQRAIKDAILYVESDPCNVCAINLYNALPTGSKLTVFSPTHGETLFRSSQYK